MPHLLTFLLYTAAFVLAGNCVLRIFFAMIQDGGMLDQAFGYRAMLNRLYRSEKRWKNNLGKALGDCEMCMSFWFMLLWYGVYMSFSFAVLKYYITDEVDSWWAKGLVGFVWYIVFHASGAIGGLLFLIRAKLKAKHGVRMSDN